MGRLLSKALKKVMQALRNMKNRNKDTIPEGEKGESRTYEVSAIRDSRTCALCRERDGITFTITPDDSADVIAARMATKVPPFHIQCRCQLKEV